ncbi:MAG: creatininase family protein [Kofleriaceae bacterium]|nr:creatininase family protein [Kofleriaceae bacterium]MCL4228149.1 creatininase family protein [Myxococcales bacterium]
MSARLGELTSPAVAALVAGARPVVALLPVGSTEPHGPHLPLATDVIISDAACARAVAALDAAGVTAVVAPAVPYGVTECARGFAGAVSVPAATLTAFLAAVADGLLAQGLRHVCLVNNHLEPAHDAAVRAVTAGREGWVSVACPLTRRWARTLSAEFKSGACHAGRYETSIVLAATPGLVDDAARAGLPEVPVSLSEQLAAGVTTFAAMGLDRAYAGAPAAATAAEGDEQLARLTEMIVATVGEALALPP